MPLLFNAFRKIVDYANDAVMVTEAKPLAQPGPRIVYVNAAMCQLCGYSPEELLGCSPRLLQGPLTDPATLALLHEALRAGREVTVELMNYQRSSMPYWAEVHVVPLSSDDGELTHFAAIQRDITAIRMKPDALYRTAVSDELTSLFNRQMFFDVGAKFLQLAYRQGTPLSVAVLVIDDLQRVQEQHGQMVASVVLRVMAQAVRAAIRDSDIAGRLSVQSFGLLLPDAPQETVQLVLARIRANLADSLRVTSLPQGAHLTVSMGVALAQADDYALEQVLNRAEQALQQTRAQGESLSL